MIATPVKMTESLVQSVLMGYVMDQKNHQMALPNLTVLYNWECDLVSVTKAWLVHEFEIKLSKSDFKADFKKEGKHDDLNQRFSRKSTHRPPQTPMQQRLIEMNPHYFKRRTPNYFWYVIGGEFEVDVPPYAGLMRIRKRGKHFRAIVAKPAPRIHSEKMKEKNRLNAARWLSYKLKNEYYRGYECD